MPDFPFSKCAHVQKANSIVTTLVTTNIPIYKYVYTIQRKRDPCKCGGKP